MTLVSASHPVAQTAKPDPALRKAAEAFEAVILRQMMASMRSAKLGDDLCGSNATDNFREMADARLADNMASLRQFGIANLVERQLGGAAKTPFASSPSTARRAGAQDKLPQKAEIERRTRHAQSLGVSTTLDTNGDVK